MSTPLLSVIESQKVEDTDAMAGVVTALDAEYVQLETKRFTGRWTVVRTPQMVLQRGREDIAVVRRLRAQPGFWSFIVPLSVGESARWDACAVSPDDLIVCAPGAESYAFDPGGTEFAIVSVPERHEWARAAGRFLAAGERSCTVVQRASDAASLHQHLVDVLETDESFDRTLAHFNRPAAAGPLELERSLRRAVPRGRRREAAASRRHVVGRAESFFRGHLGEPVSIARLSSAAGVSERTLRNAFYDVYTTGPKRYLKLWQLHQVRRALRSAHSEEHTVTNVATFHGFFELGRFSGEYKALFGEAPSQTLYKARARRAESEATMPFGTPMPASHQQTAQGA
jgi:AraC family transcriptional regulator, ethanolamine operon transcriptional activator